MKNFPRLAVRAACIQCLEPEILWLLNQGWQTCTMLVITDYTEPNLPTFDDRSTINGGQGIQVGQETKSRNLWEADPIRSVLPGQKSAPGCKQALV